jgi:cobaltochelatase CobN
MKMNRRLFSALLCALLLTSEIAIAAGENILFVTGRHSNKAKLNLLKEYGKEHDLTINRQAQSELGDSVAAQNTFSQYDLVIFEAASVRESKMIYPQYAPLVAQGNQRFIAIKWWQEVSLRKGVDEQQAQLLNAYYDNGGKENLTRLIDHLHDNIFANNPREIAAPIIFPDIGLYHPNHQGLVFETFNDYQRWWQQYSPNKTDKQPVIGLLMQRSLIESVQTQVVDHAIAELESRGAKVMPFFFELSPRISDYKHLIQLNGETQVDLIISFRSIHWAKQREKEFRQFGVPVMPALTYMEGDQQAWEQDIQGISPGMTPFVLIMPESAGVIDPMIVAAVDDVTGEAQVIDYQLHHMVNKVLNVVSLKYTANEDKKVTVMTWGDKQVGASFLNIPDSLQNISQRLNKEGYTIDVVGSDYYTDNIDRILNPFYRNVELEQLLDDDLAELLPVKEYLEWFNRLPVSVTQAISDHWGHPNDNFMVVEREGQWSFIIPRIRNGNMLVMRQPPRSDNKKNNQEVFHNGDAPINHYYLAAYYYARDYWGSDAIIHLGTHGSQEYLGGKERGLSIYDESNLAVWDTPVLYPFIVDDVGEAVQTKRRGRATVFSHMTPPFAAVGLQGDLSGLHELMHQYKSLDEGGVKKKTAQQLIDDCITTHICLDFGWSQEQINADFSGFMDALHEYMRELAVANQPLGLHSYGELAAQPLLISTLVQMLGQEFAEAAAVFERDFFNHGHSHGGNNHSHHDKSTETVQDSLHHNGEELVDIVGFKTVEKFILGAFDQQGQPLSTEALTTLDKPLSEAMESFISQGRDMYINYTSIKEMDYLVDGLSGKYIPIKNGGDPIRHPDAVPTGFNLYGFDPSRIPTKAAYAQGKELTEALISDYYDKHGNYPDKLAFSLWSIETMRHHGVLEAQALYAMGVKPTWSRDGRVVGTEIIPYSELKRPRIDVVLSATGLYRDGFPNVMQMLAKAVEQIAQLEEDSNAVWRNSQRIQQELMAEGIDSEEAQYLSTVRLFSSESGRYGSGVNGPVFESETWDSDTKISDQYLSRMGYFFGSDNSRWGQKLEAVSLYAKQLSGTDVALFSRSSNLYGMITTDDPFEYFGSLSLAVRNIDGKSPDMLVSNLRDADNPKAVAVAKFLAKELRIRNFNKRWLEEMMKEGYSGATTLSSNLANFWGWQVVDPDAVRNDQWDEFFEVYINDKHELGIDEWFEQVNPAAQAQMLETMLESVRKNYWQADEQTLKAMLERYIELVNDHELFVDNEKLREFVDQQAGGFGLTPLPADIASIMTDAATMREVEGQKLEKVEQQEASEQPWDMQLMMIFAACLLMFVIGLARQFFSSRLK